MPVDRASSPRRSARIQAKEEQALNPRTAHYEFAGTIGALFITITLPVVIYGLFFFCGQKGCPPPVLAEVLDAFRVEDLVHLPAFLAYLAWNAWFVLLWFMIPGPWVDGTELRNGRKLKYKINALYSFLVTIGAVAGTVYYSGLAPLVWIADHYLGLATASVIYSFLQSMYLYAASFRKGALLALGGNTGSFIYDFFIGRELNPRIGNFDLKSFFELRPGLIGWVLLDVAFAAKQYSVYGEVTDSMALVLLFQAYYVADSLYFEPAVLTTMDIIQDGFGYMLTFGDIAWVPFTYSLQCRYLSHYPNRLGPVFTGAIVAVQLLGVYIFRSSNSQKNAFRTNPDDPTVRHLKTLETKTGSKLLISGWWGTARHINYLGDWIMAWAWCLPTGFKTPITYFYVIYFAILLVHRDMRDDEKCSKKYGSDWVKYCKLVPYRIIPYVY